MALGQRVAERALLEVHVKLKQSNHVLQQLRLSHDRAGVRRVIDREDMHVQVARSVTATYKYVGM